MTIANTLSERKLADMQADYRFYVKERAAAVKTANRPIAALVGALLTLGAAAFVVAAVWLVPAIFGDAGLTGLAWAGTTALMAAGAAFAVALTRIGERRNARQYIPYLDDKIDAAAAALTAAGQTPDPTGEYPTRLIRMPRRSRSRNTVGAPMVSEGELTDGFLLQLFS